VSPAENLKSSKIQASELWGTKKISKYLEMKKMGVLEIEAYKYVTWRIKNNLMDCVASHQIILNSPSYISIGFSNYSSAESGITTA
jgi:hypothetical protein